MEKKKQKQKRKKKNEKKRENGRRGRERGRGRNHFMPSVFYSEAIFRQRDRDSLWQGQARKSSSKDDNRMRRGERRSEEEKICQISNLIDYFSISLDPSLVTILFMFNESNEGEMRDLLLPFFLARWAGQIHFLLSILVNWSLFLSLSRSLPLVSFGLIESIGDWRRRRRRSRFEMSEFIFRKKNIN